MTETGYAPPVLTLDPDKQSACKRNMRFIRDLGPLIDKVEKCKVNCDSYRQLRDTLLEINQAIADEFCDKEKLPV